jgi:hypothetical protein
MSTPSKTVPDVSLEGLQHNSDILVLGNQQHWELYPTDEALSFRSVERTSKGIGLVLTLTTSFEFGSLEVTDEGHAVVSTDGPVITISFPNEKAMEPQFHALSVVAISTSGERTTSHNIKFQFASKARDATNGRTTNDRVVVKETDLKLSYSFINDWVIETPTDEDRSYAQQRWGDLISADAASYSRARVITRAVIDDFEPQRGTPSDMMTRLHPFRQHERILAKIDHGWCANLSEVLCLALNSMDIPARLVRMRNTYHNAESDEPGNNFEVLLAGGHTIVEIFDRTLQQWIWIDPSQRQLGARDAGGHYLNLAEIHHRVNQPHQAADLKLDAYDPATGKEKAFDFADSPIRPNMLHYAKREQRFYYFKRPAE